MKKPTVEELIQRRNKHLAEKQARKAKKRAKTINLLSQTRKDAQMMLYGAMQAHGRIHYELLMDTCERYPFVRKMFTHIENRMLFILIMTYAVDCTFLYSRTFAKKFGFTFKQDIAAIGTVMRRMNEYELTDKQSCLKANKYWLNEKGREMAEWIKFRMITKYTQIHFLSMAEYKKKLPSSTTDSVRQQLTKYRQRAIDREKDVL